MRLLVIGVVLVLAAGAVSADDRVLVSNCMCNVGGAGSSESRDWYVQLGVFSDRDAADAFGEAMQARGLIADTYGAGWLTQGDTLADGPWVVVSRAHATRADARRALKRYRRAASDALVRRFLTCPDDVDE